MNNSDQSQTMTHLPPEVLNLVVIHIRSNRSAQAAQKDMYSFCLVSKDWYASTIKALYETPVLSSRNFAEFARTLSPPLSSRTRRVGLEDFVQCLNMGTIAYESKKSTTSRLISRTKRSLRVFIAPAVSFSTTSLAPLSKCANLELLDLSRDVYDFSLPQLLRSVRGLSKLAYLSLPKDSMPFEHVSQMDEMKANYWPSNLISLQLNDAYMLPSTSHWNSFLRTLPPNLDTLSFRNLAVYDFFDEAVHVEVLADQVQTLSVGVHRSDDTYSFNLLSLPFPNVSKMIIPAMTTWITKDFIFTSQNSTWTLTASGSSLLKPPKALEILVLEESADFPVSSHIGVPDLKQFVEQCPTLLRIDVPEAYLNIDDEDDSALDDVNEILTERAASLGGGSRGVDVVRAGIFMTESASTVGVGLKRSFRYRGND